MRRITWTGLGLAALAAACASAPPQPPKAPDLAAIYSAPDAPLGGYALYASDVRFVVEYTPPLTEPNIEHQYPIGPTDLAREWAAMRLRPAGADGVVTVTVLDGSVVETDIASDGRLLSGVKDRPTREFMATLRLAVDYKGRFEDTRAETTVRGRVSVNRYDSAVDAEERYYATMATMAKRLDQEMAKVMTRNFSGLTRTPGSGDGAVTRDGTCPDPVIVDLGRGGSLRVGSQPVAAGALQQALTEIAARCPVIDALILAADDAPGRSVIETMAAARAAGLRPVLERRAGL
ncbi:MAG: hypothetical protein AAFR11_07725 [Pseudomonadota bacterium]